MADEQTPMQGLEKALQEFVDHKARIDEGSPGLVTDFFVAIGYTRIDEDGDQPFSRTYVASSNPYGSMGVAELTMADARHDLGCDECGDEDVE